MLQEIVFVGGQVTELLVTDTAAVRARPTTDVDIVVPVSTRTAYQHLQAHLATVGFHPDRLAGAPVCRFRSADGLILDVMPLANDVLGFTNRWYGEAMQQRLSYQLAQDLSIFIPTAPVFLATKWEAFQARGTEDPRFSHDLEDVITLVAGRASIVDECEAESLNVKSYLTEEARRFLDDPAHEELILAALPDAVRFPELVSLTIQRFRSMAAPASEG
jgi:predicted nucleotidyltransferase